MIDQNLLITIVSTIIISVSAQIIAGNQNYDLSLDVTGISSSLQYRNNITESGQTRMAQQRTNRKKHYLIRYREGQGFIFY
ncbi:MAG: hypothetical protein ISS16_10850 [Ignavibacteria bacterium]|nr:hypothetical protein [Bacteroidota bacterium]MBL7129464.1 hypothetical protein [Ignavibacteria bacterium]